MTEVSSLEARFSGNTQSFDDAAERVRNTMTDTGRTVADSLRSIGSGMTSTGSDIIKLSAPAAAVFTGAIASAVVFEESMTNARSILGITADEMAGINEQVLALGGASRAGPHAAAEAYYNIVSGVQDASAHMAILENSIALSEAGSADLTTTTSGLVAVMNAYNLEASMASRVSDIYSRTVAMGVGSMDEFVSALSPAAGLAATVGVSFEELAEGTAFLTAGGATASGATTQLMGIMNAFLKPNAEMTKALETMGFASGAAAIESLGLAEAVYALNQATGGLDGTLAASLGTSEALRGATGLLSEEFAGFHHSFIEGLDGATAAAREIQLESAAAQFDLLTSRLAVASIIIGGAFLPAINEVSADLIPIADGIAAWAAENPELVRTIGVVAIAALGLGIGLVALGQVISAAASVFGVLKGAVALVTSPMLLLGGAIAIAAGAIGWALTDFQGFKDFVDTNFTPGIQAAAEDIRGAFGEQFVSDVQTRFNELTDTFSNLWSGIDPHVQTLKTGLADVGTFISENVLSGSMFDDFGAKMGTAFGKIGETVGKGIQGAGDLAVGMFAGLGERIREAAPGLQSFMEDIFAGAQGAAVAVVGYVNDTFIPRVATLSEELGPFAGPIAAAFEAAFAGGLAIVQGVVGAINEIGGAVQAALIHIGLLSDNMTPEFQSSYGAGTPGFTESGALMTGYFGPPGSGGMGTVTGPGTAGLGQQSGTHWTGSGALSSVAGFHHNQEAVVPAHGMRVIPSPRGLMLDGGGGGGGGSTNISTINLYGVQDPESMIRQLRDRYGIDLPRIGERDRQRGR